MANEIINCHFFNKKNYKNYFTHHNLLIPLINTKVLFILIGKQIKTEIQNKPPPKKKKKKTLLSLTTKASMVFHWLIAHLVPVPSFQSHPSKYSPHENPRETFLCHPPWLALLSTSIWFFSSLHIYCHLPWLCCFIRLKPSGLTHNSSSQVLRPQHWVRQPQHPSPQPSLKTTS